MLRVVLDTNVLVSGLLFQGPPRQLLYHVLASGVGLVTSADLTAELDYVLETKFPHARLAIQDMLESLRALALFVEPSERIVAVPEDPDDNIVLECAIAAEAGAIVSGDRHLLALKTFRGIPILSPQAFLDSLHQEK